MPLNKPERSNLEDERFSELLRRTMSLKEKAPTSPKSPLRRRRLSWAGTWLNHQTPSFKHVVSAAIQAQSPRSRFKSQISGNSGVDRTLLLSDSLLLKILRKVPQSQYNDLALVCKRWFDIVGRCLRDVKVFDLDFCLSGRLVSRFPKLRNVDLTNACLNSSKNSGILLCQKSISFQISTDSSLYRDFVEENLLNNEMVDTGLRVLGRGSSDLRKLKVINATELGLLSLHDCLYLQELELHMCNDNLLRGIAACKNLRALRLFGCVDGLYSSSVTDIGLTILAQGCKRLVKVELSGCEGSFDGIKAIGQCCEVLGELTICDHRMDDGWIAALSYFESLKTLKISSCRKIDSSPGPENLLESCPALESLQLQRCCLNDKEGMRALFKVCNGVTKVDIQDCWGLDDESFSFAKAFRKVRSLSLEGCSVLTTNGFESVILHWEELESMRIVSCKNIKDKEISAALSPLFSRLRELTWKPDTRSHLSSSLKSNGIGKRGSRFFKKS